MSELSYTGKYEYACSMINLWLTREIQMCPDKDRETIFGDNSFIRGLFISDFSMIKNKDVRDELTKRLTISEDIESRPYQMALTRLKTTYVDMYGALGKEFMDALSTNIVEGLIKVCGSISGNELKDINHQFTEFYKKFPYAILFTVGNKLFATEMIKSRREQMMSTQNIAH